MKVLIKEKLSEHKVKTPEGYLICMDSVIARTGPQEYYKSELFGDAGDDSMISVDRKADQVFSPETLASFENKPLTCEHPDENVTPDNYKDLSVGYVRDVRKGKYENQDVMLANLVVTDPDTIKDIEKGVRTELSCGYDCDITDGDHPEQINIRGNHVALCEQGRAGIAKIVDSVPDKPNSIIYKGYYIEHDFYGEDEYTVQYLGDDIWFDTLEEAKSFIDETIEHNRDMIRDHAIATKDTTNDTYSEGFKEKLKEILENQENALDDETDEILDDETAKRYNHQKHKTLEEIRRQLGDLDDEKDQDSGD
jgi:hypothetical protein